MERRDLLFRAQDDRDHSRSHAPKILELVSQSVNNASTDLGFLFCLLRKPWSMIEDIGIDYAIMEKKAQNLVAVPFTSKWSDLGGWDAVWSEGNQDRAGNVLSDAAQLRCTIASCDPKATISKLLGWVLKILWLSQCPTRC